MRRTTIGLALTAIALLVVAGCSEANPLPTPGQPGTGGSGDGATGGGGGGNGGGGGIGGPEQPSAGRDGLGDEGFGQDATDGDQHEAPGTNPFVVASHDPQSTFSVDVDTASYELFRRDVNAGYLPNEDGVRLEEYVNYFSYDYPAPAFGADVPFTISLAAAPSPYTEGTTLMRVGIRGMKPPPKGDQPPANLVFLVDVSGSMSSSDKLGLVKVVLREALAVLEPADTVSIVTYASATGVRLPPTPVSERDAIVAVIDGLEAGGSTAGASGIELAYEQAQAGFIEGGLNHVLLCSDGDFNVGVSSTEALVELIETKRDTGITFTVLGFGSGNLNDAMMEAISNKGNGVYGVIADEDQAIDYVHDRLLSTMYFIAKDVKIQVDMNPDRVHAYRLLGYENRDIADIDFLDDTIDAGEIGAGHRVTALYELVLTGGSVPTAAGAPEIEEGPAFDGELSVRADELARVKVRYKDVDARIADAAHQVDAGLSTSAVLAAFADADGDFRWAASIAAFAEILKDSPYGDRAHLELIRAVVEAEAGSDPDRNEFVSLFDTAASLLAQ